MSTEIATQEATEKKPSLRDLRRKKLIELSNEARALREERGTDEYLNDIIISEFYTKAKDGDNVTYELKTNNDGTPKNNSAWTINQNIWNEIVEGNQKEEGLSQRYVSIYDFESSHNYVYDKSKGKPLSAYEFANSIPLDSDESIISFVDMICGVKEKLTEFTPENLDELVTEPNE